MTAIDYLIALRPALLCGHVSVFFADDRAGTVRGLYFGDAGSGTPDEAYFRMEASAGGVDRFLECDSAEDAFRVDRDGACRRRQAWWTFKEGDDARLDAARVATLQGMPFARSPGFYGDALGLIRQYGSLHGC